MVPSGSELARTHLEQGTRLTGVPRIRMSCDKPRQAQACLLMALEIRRSREAARPGPLGVAPNVNETAVSGRRQELVVAVCFAFVSVRHDTVSISESDPDQSLPDVA